MESKNTVETIKLSGIPLAKHCAQLAQEEEGRALGLSKVTAAAMMAALRDNLGAVPAGSTAFSLKHVKSPEGDDLYVYLEEYSYSNGYWRGSNGPLVHKAEYDALAINVFTQMARDEGFDVSKASNEELTLFYIPYPQP